MQMLGYGTDCGFRDRTNGFGGGAAWDPAVVHDRCGWSGRVCRTHLGAQSCSGCTRKGVPGTDRGRGEGGLDCFRPPMALLHQLIARAYRFGQDPRVFRISGGKGGWGFIRTWTKPASICHAGPQCGDPATGQDDGQGSALMQWIASPAVWPKATGGCGDERGGKGQKGAGGVALMHTMWTARGWRRPRQDSSNHGCVNLVTWPTYRPETRSAQLPGACHMMS
mmetsp:Transcript_52956/g.94471  ORF Transcript_52956/g.94471 Transcript_52956/m.94471 type:complete len:223 (-) Transcript_52956:8813-9481(-)